MKFNVLYYYMKASGVNSKVSMHRINMHVEKFVPTRNQAKCICRIVQS